MSSKAGSTEDIITLHMYNNVTNVIIVNRMSPEDDLIPLSRKLGKYKK